MASSPRLPSYLRDLATPTGTSIRSATCPVPLTEVALSARPARPDADLVAAIAARDRTAFADLFGQLAPRVKGYLLRAVRDELRADDLTQEVMLRVWRKAHTYDASRGEVSTWVFVMARSVMIDAIRREQRPQPTEDDVAFVPAHPPGPEQAAVAARRRRSVHAAIGALPQEQAQVLRSAYFEGKSLRTIAGELNVPLGTVKSRSRLAIHRLRAVLTAEVAA